MPHQLLTISHHVAWITLHHPPANVLNLSVLKELEQVLNEVEEDEYVRVVIVTGTGRFFCAGADVHELAHLTTVHSGLSFARSWTVTAQPHRAVGEAGSCGHQRHLRRRWARTGSGLPHSGGGTPGRCWGCLKSNSVSFLVLAALNGCRESSGLPKRRK